jgi:hypothetical protein
MRATATSAYKQQYLMTGQNSIGIWTNKRDWEEIWKNGSKEINRERERE